MRSDCPESVASTTKRRNAASWGEAWNGGLASTLASAARHSSALGASLRCPSSSNDTCALLPVNHRREALDYSEVGAQIAIHLLIEYIRFGRIRSGRRAASQRPATASWPGSDASTLIEFWWKRSRRAPLFGPIEPWPGWR